MPSIVALDASSTLLRYTVIKFDTQLNIFAPEIRIDEGQVGVVGWDLDALSPNQVISRIAETITIASKKAQDEVVGIGVGVRARIQPNTGYWIPTHNPWRLENNNPFPFARPLQQAIAMPSSLGKYIPLAIGNRTNLSAWGEALYGNAKNRDLNHTDVVFVMVEKFLGLGLVSERKIKLGRHGMSNEYGHFTLNGHYLEADNDIPAHLRQCPACGKSNCASILAAGLAITRLAYSSVEQGNIAQIDNIMGFHRNNLDVPVDRGGTIECPTLTDPTGSIDALAIIQAADDVNIGSYDSKARQILAHVGVNLGLIVQHAISSYDPDMIILGGLATQSSTLFQTASNEGLKAMLAAFHNDISITTSELEDFAPLYGAAHKGWQSYVTHQGQVSIDTF